jgi:ATP-binding cassette subfamily C (CFTR/MRP) protein 1
LATIRAFGWQGNFKSLNYQRLDTSQRPFYLLFCLQRWLALVLDCFSAGFTLLIVGLVIGLREKVSTGFAGVALTNMMNLSSMMSALVLIWTQLETSIASVERVKKFEHETPSETSNALFKEPPARWPDKGHVKIQELNATYRYELIL